MKPAAEWVDEMCEHMAAGAAPLSDAEREGIAQFFRRIQDDAAGNGTPGVVAVLIEDVYYESSDVAGIYATPRAAAEAGVEMAKKRKTRHSIAAIPDNPLDWEQKLGNGCLSIQEMVVNGAGGG